MKVLAVSAFLYVACVSPALSDDAAFCLLVNRVAAEDKLGAYADDHLGTGFCMVAKAVDVATAANDTSTVQICLLSTDYMAKEFKRRFPNRDPREGLGKCD